jgi:Flp pilus assembly protein TadB
VRSRGRSGTAPADLVATAVRALAGSIRAGTPPRAALETWRSIAPPDLDPALRGVARRLALGASVDDALAAAPSLPAALARCFSLHRAAGGSLPALLDAAAERPRARHGPRAGAGD